MTVIDSGTRTLLTTREESLYVSTEEWGQPPASHQVTEILVGQRTEEQGEPGTIYATTRSTHTEMDPELEAEFAAWDLASDEALANFEAELG